MYLVLKIMQLIVMLYAAYQDVKHKEISILSIVICALLSVAAVVISFITGENIGESLIALLPGGLFLIISLVSRGGIGIGDGILLMGIGPAFGIWHVVIGTMVALGLSCLISIFLLAFRKGTAKSTLPFIPFLTIGMGVIMFA